MHIPRIDGAQLNSSGLVLPFADHITVLSEGGRIINHELAAADYAESDSGVSTAAVSTSDGSSEKGTDYDLSEQVVLNVATHAAETTVLDSARQTGDMSVYLYYARAAGLLVTVCFLSVTMACTFCESFAGESSREQR